MGLGHLAAAVLAMIGSWSIGAPSAAPQAAAPAERACAPRADMAFLCEQKNAEDMEFLPGTRWVIAGGMTSAALPGNAFGIIDSATRAWHAGYPLDGIASNRLDRATYRDCPGAPDPKSFGPHGISIAKDSDGSFTLLAVNHGGRDAIEAFRVTISAGAVPAISWVGCVPLPGPMLWNSVVINPLGGFYVTQMTDGHDPAAMTRYLSAEPVGAVYAWTAAGGLKPVPHARFAGNNGITVSPDGRWLFVNAHMTNEVVKLDMAKPDAPREAGRLWLDFMPDNVKWAPDGTIIAAGQHTSEKQLVDTFYSDRASVPFAWSAAKIDPVTMSVKGRIDRWGNRDFGGGTVALEVGDEIWSGAFRADRIARVPARWRSPD